LSRAPFVCVSSWEMGLIPVSGCPGWRERPVRKTSPQNPLHRDRPGQRSAYQARRRQGSAPGHADFSVFAFLSLADGPEDSFAPSCYSARSVPSVISSGAAGAVEKSVYPLASPMLPRPRLRYRPSTPLSATCPILRGGVCCIRAHRRPVLQQDVRVGYAGRWDLLLPEIRGAGPCAFNAPERHIRMLCPANSSRKASQYAPEVHRMGVTMLCDFRVEEVPWWGQKVGLAKRNSLRPVKVTWVSAPGGTSPRTPGTQKRGKRARWCRSGDTGHAQALTSVISSAYLPCHSERSEGIFQARLPQLTEIQGIKPSSLVCLRGH